MIISSLRIIVVITKKVMLMLDSIHIANGAGPSELYLDHLREALYSWVYP